MILNVRGKRIEIDEETIKKSKVLSVYKNGPWLDNKQPYYLNYEVSLVHKLLNHLNGDYYFGNDLEQIRRELVIDDGETIFESNMHIIKDEFLNFNTHYHHFSGNSTIIAPYFTYLSKQKHIHLLKFINYEIQIDEGFMI